jgi:hypothetical protein
MPGQLKIKLKWWAAVLVKGVAMYRHLTGSYRGTGVLAFVFAKGFKQS